MFPCREHLLDEDPWSASWDPFTLLVCISLLDIIHWCLHTSIFIETPSVEGLPTKAKEDPSPHEMRLSPAVHQPSISWSRGIIYNNNNDNNNSNYYYYYNYCHYIVFIIAIIFVFNEENSPVKCCKILFISSFRKNLITIVPVPMLHTLQYQYCIHYSQVHPQITKADNQYQPKHNSFPTYLLTLLLHFAIFKVLNTDGMKTFQTEGEQLVSDLTNLLKRLHEKLSVASM